MIMNMTGGSASGAIFTHDGANFRTVICSEQVELPTSLDGVAMNQALDTYNISEFWARLIWSNKKVVVPEYYTTARIGGPMGNLYYAALEEIECRSHGQITIENGGNYVNYHILRCPNTTSRIIVNMAPVLANGYTVPVTHSNATIQVPNSPEVQLFIGRQDNPLTLDADFTSCVTFGANSRNHNNGRFWTGTVHLPNCETITYTYPDRGETTLYLPNVQQFTNYFMNNAQTSGGIVHLYVGPDLSMLSNINATWWATYGSHVDFHIPPGDSTTKQMLDGEGITYTQDYII